ncbi:twin-arginine translocase TatA/TatE family subunit [Halomarina oriensis]|uniref:Sec-independent protein translocase protein TatA n=1 Tax=Halomarina oriensis TaxID=671145 RepID=A0A6B0GN61_9EURY|nr:twin-arginine translocase TatA/TatE family subunit [Halomarina oriensis]MWG36366.1 twin-arginine translocase TatA/TatE family subunit [Halomarina oriensis]
MPTVPLFPGIPGGIEVFVVLLIIVLLFGANKLPKLARSSGQAMGEFKKGREEMEAELSEMKGDAMGTNEESETATSTADADSETTNNSTETA